MRYQQHIIGDWFDLKSRLKLKFPLLTEKDVNINEKDPDAIMTLSDKLQMTRQQFIWMLKKL